MFDPKVLIQKIENVASMGVVNGVTPRDQAAIYGAAHALFLQLAWMEKDKEDLNRKAHFMIASAMEILLTHFDFVTPTANPTPEVNTVLPLLIGARNSL